MTQPQDNAPDLSASTDVQVDADELEQRQDEQAQDATPTSSAAGYEQGDTEGGTGGLDAGGAG